jgi:outer membrane protein assembly factor BamC
MQKLMKPVAATSAACLLILAGCTSSSLDVDRRGDYQNAKSTKSLALPPKVSNQAQLQDILRVNGNIGSARTAVNPNVPATDLIGEGLKRWIRIAAPAEAIWTQLDPFWASQGFNLESSQPTIGIMETDWSVDSDKSGTVLGGLLASLQSAPHRDRFRTRLDSKGPNTTDIFITHYGQKSSGGTYGWLDEASDPELEIEMLKRLMVYLGYGSAKAEKLLANAQAGTNINPILAKDADLGNNIRGLVVAQSYNKAWETVGFAVEGLGYDFIDKNIRSGYYIIKPRPTNFWGKLSGLPSGDNLRLSLRDLGDRTTVAIKDKDGKQYLTDSKTRAFFKKLKAQLNP